MQPDNTNTTRWDTEARAICVKLIPHTTSVHNARIVADAIAAARADERERCAAILDEAFADPGWNGHYKNAAHNIAARIRGAS